MKRSTLIWTFATILAVSAAAPAAVAIAAENQPAGRAPAAGESPRVEVVFVLDTTGSMGGLIEGAKLKIWSIANQIVKGTPRPELEVGLVAYRDRGDAYVTRVFDLSSDLDEVYGNLASFQAGGGGDTPEHVSRALQEAVEDISWSTDDRTLRIVFLVGDAPPHVDYKDGYDYEAACGGAVLNDIIVNTIQCGALSGTAAYWQEIARLGEGEYAAIPQTGGMRSIPTPMDDEISKLSADLDATVVAWGDEEQIEKKERAEAMAEEMPAAAKSARAAFRTTGGRMGAYDLIGALESGEVKLENIAVRELPKEMRGMNAAEKRGYLEQKKAQREQISRQIIALNEKRDAFIKAKLAETSDEDAFDARVLAMIRAQASGKGLVY